MTIPVDPSSRRETWRALSAAFLDGGAEIMRRARPARGVHCTRNVTRTTLLSTVTRIVLISAALVWFAGCSGADDRPPVADLGSAGAAGSSGSGSAGAGGATSTDPTSCDHDTVRECKVKLPSHAGVSNCFVGVQLCDSGKWGKCMDPADVP